MNLPNKVTIGRIILSVCLLILLVIPWYNLNIYFPDYVINGEVLSLKYIIGGIVFLIACCTDFIDGHLARKNNMVTDFGKVADAIADKMLVNGVLIILAYNRMIPLIIPVVIITRDIVVDSLKMFSGTKGKVVAASKLGKLKTICMMSGITLTFFNNLPFSYLNIPVSSFLLLIATLLSVISACDYYNKTKDLFSKDI